MAIVVSLVVGVENERFEAHIRPMDQILPSELNDFEFEALRQLAAHPVTRQIPSRIDRHHLDARRGLPAVPSD
jgi:hypothetical protein